MTVSNADDSGALSNGLAPHFDGNPLSVINDNPSAVHTMLIIFGALAILWLFGGVLFKKIRM